MGCGSARCRGLYPPRLLGDCVIRRPRGCGGGSVVSLNLIGWVMAGAIGVGFRLSRSEFIAISMEHSIRQEGTGVIRRGNRSSASPYRRIADHQFRGGISALGRDERDYGIAGRPPAGVPGMNSTKTGFEWLCQTENILPI